MMPTFLFLKRCAAIALIFFLGWSCTESDFLSDAEKPVNAEASEIANVLNLTEDIEIVNEIITLLPFKSDFLKSAEILWEHDFVLMHVANIPVPESGKSDALSASSIFIDRDYVGDGVKAFIGYSTRGDSTRGALKILTFIDTLNKTDETVMLDLDVNDICVEGNTAYLACSDFNNGAVVYSINTTTLDVDTVFILSDFFDGDITSTANGIAPLSGKFAVSAGRTYGGAFIIKEESGEFVKDSAYFASTAKSIATNSDQNEIALLLGGDESDNADLLLISPTGVLVKTIDLGDPVEFQNVEESAKFGGRAQVRYLNDTLVIATLGKYGAVVVNIDTEEILSTPGNMLTDGNTNSVSFDTIFVYFANGADGLFLADFDVITPNELIDPEWVWNTENGMPPGSVNSVESDGKEWIIIAKGLDGIHLLKLENAMLECDVYFAVHSEDAIFRYGVEEPVFEGLPDGSHIGIDGETGTLYSTSDSAIIYSWKGTGAFKKWNDLNETSPGIPFNPTQAVWHNEALYVWGPNMDLLKITEEAVEIISSNCCNCDRLVEGDLIASEDNKLISFLFKYNHFKYVKCIDLDNQCNNEVWPFPELEDSIIGAAVVNGNAQVYGGGQTWTFTNNIAEVIVNEQDVTPNSETGDQASCEELESACDLKKSLLLNYITANIFFRIPAYLENAESPEVDRTFNTDSTITVANFVGNSDEEEWLSKFFNNDGSFKNDSTFVKWELLQGDDCDLIIKERWLSEGDSIDLARELHLCEWDHLFFSVEMFTYDTGETPDYENGNAFVYINKNMFNGSWTECLELIEDGGSWDDE